MRVAIFVMLMGIILTYPDYFYANNQALKDVEALFSNFFQIVATFISSVGAIVGLYCIAEIGGSWMGQGNGGAQFEAFRRMGGAILWICAPQLISLFTY